jgi:cell division protein FtsI (penicillin-binding protein 3)
MTFPLARFWRGRRAANSEPRTTPVERDWRATLSRRVSVTLALMACWAGGIEARLVYLQVIDRADLVDRAERQQMHSIPSAAKRGDILDRNGHVLATSVDADTIYAVPSAVGDERDTIARICRALGDCTAKEQQDLVERLQKQRNFAYIRRQVAPEQARRVRELNLDGIDFMKESRRYYPSQELAGHVVGFVGLDNRGLAGIESAYNTQIRGKDGKILFHADARRHVFSRSERPPTAGSTIELTIDQYIQHIAERELAAGVLENRALGGTALVLNPHTGEILAMANVPTFDPNQYREATETARRNRAVMDLYEPGSTFKSVTVSAALENKIMPVTTMIETGGGQIRIGSRVVHDTHDYGTLSMMDVIVHSSNVGAIKIGFRLGTDLLSEFVEKFGFGHPVSPDFPNESPGIVWDRAKWTESALASVSMGYQVGVTPLQMVAAVSAIANRGEYIEPRVVRAVYKGDRRYEVKPKVLRRVISPDTAASVTEIMEQVVERGTATIAKMPGFTVAGKTGTANKLVNGRYSNDTYASFVGFVPSRNPAIAILVVLDSPRGSNGHFGAGVSAPIWKRIADAALRYLSVPPNINAPPPVLVPPSDAPVQVSLPELMSPAEPRIADVPGTVPDVRGMAARDAMRRMTTAGLVVRLSGNGVVVSQDPPPGEALVEGAMATLTLERSAVGLPPVPSGQ